MDINFAGGRSTTLTRWWTPDIQSVPLPVQVSNIVHFVVHHYTAQLAYPFGILTSYPRSSLCVVNHDVGRETGRVPLLHSFDVPLPNQVRVVEAPHDHVTKKACVGHSVAVVAKDTGRGI